MPVIVDCPSCNRKLRVTDELMGQRVKCPTCGEMFPTAPPAEPTPPPLPGDMGLSPAGERRSDPDPGAGPPPEWPASTGATPGAPEPLGGPPIPPPSLPTDQHFRLSLEEGHPSPAPGAAETLTIPPPPASAPPGVLPPPGPPPWEEEHAEDSKTCPYCKERIPREASRCRYCGEDQGDEDRPSRPWERGVRRDSEPHRGPMILTFGIISMVALAFCGPLGLPFAIVAWVMGSRDLKKMEANLMDPRGRGLTQAGMILGIVGTIIDGLCLIGYLLYAGFIVVMIISGQ